MTDVLRRRPWLQPVVLVLAPAWSLAAVLTTLLFAVDARPVPALVSAALSLAGTAVAAAGSKVVARMFRRWRSGEWLFP